MVRVTDTCIIGIEVDILTQSLCRLERSRVDCFEGEQFTLLDGWLGGLISLQQRTEDTNQMLFLDDNSTPYEGKSNSHCDVLCDVEYTREFWWGGSLVFSYLNAG